MIFIATKVFFMHSIEDNSSSLKDQPHTLKETASRHRIDRCLQMPEHKWFCTTPTLTKRTDFFASSKEPALISNKMPRIGQRQSK